MPKGGGRLPLSGNSTSQPPHGSIQIRCVTSILLNRAVIGWNLVSLGTLTGSLVHRLQRRPRSPTLFSGEGFSPFWRRRKTRFTRLIRSEIGLPKGNNEVFPVRLHTWEN